MSYIGIPPQANFSSGLLDRFTSTTGTTVTLTHDIASENDIVVFVNFVKQDSTTYSVGGTGNKTLTLGGTLVSSDIVEVHYLNIVGQTNAPSSGSVGSSQLSADVITGQTALAVAPASTDELLISDGGVLKRIDVSLVGGSNSKTFYANLTSNQSATNGANTELVFNTEVHDVDSVYNNSNGRYTPAEVGTYFVSAGLSIDDQSGSGDDFYMKFLVNGDTSLAYSQQRSGGGHSNFSNQSGSAVITLSSTSDYISVFGYHDAGSGRNFQANLCFFTGFKLI